MISIDEAIARMLPRFAPLPAERVDLDEALGRFLAARLDAREDVPGFDNSAMDGYAVRAEDLVKASEAAPVSLPLAGESRAGGPPPSPLAPGRAMRIFTGAPMPAGADAVVMQEDVRRHGEEVAFTSPTAMGKHVRRRAEVLEAGGPLLDAGSRIGSGEIGALASQGYAQVPAHRRPRVAILSTGDELREIGEPARPGSLIDSNAHALAAAVRETGGVPVMLPRAPDQRDALTGAVRDGIASADVLLTCGGVSVGEYDLLHEAFADAGVEEVFWKVRVKPGKPIRFGVAGTKPVVGLPGNPVSALITFEVFVRPGLRAMLGDPFPFRRDIEVELAAPLRAPETRTELARVRLEERAGAPPLARPHSHQGSGALTSLVAIDALVILPEGAGAKSAGERARGLDLRGGRGAASSPFG